MGKGAWEATPLLDDGAVAGISLVKITRPSGLRKVRGGGGWEASLLELPLGEVGGRGGRNINWSSPGAVEWNIRPVCWPAREGAKQ